MKYFNPSYWFKLWLLSAPLFNNETIGINAKSIDNKKIKDWASNNTNLQSINQDMTFTNSSTNYQPYNLNQSTNQNIDPFYQTYLEETSTHKHRHEKSWNRDKRQPNPNRRGIFKLTKQLTIDSNNRQQYRNSFQSVLQSLVNNNILRVVFDNTENTNWGEINRIFTLNSQNYGYFRLPIVIRWQQNEQSLQRNFELVLRTDNLYVQGFIVTETGSHIGETSTYYHFDFRQIYQGQSIYNRVITNPLWTRDEITNTINQMPNLDDRNLAQMWNMQPRFVRDGSIPHLINIDGSQNRQLTGISPDYRDMIPTQNNNINWNSVVNSFIVLTNDINVSEEHSLGNLARSLGQVIFMTAEAIRFPDIYARIVTHLINRDENLEFNRRSEIYRILVSWGSRSRNNILQQRLIEAANNINNRNWSGFTLVDLTRELNSPSVQVLLGYINFRLRNNGGYENCRRGKREIKNTYWHEKFCDLKPQIDQIQGKITSIAVLDENTKSGNLKAGTVYVGTDNGVYLIYSEGNTSKFNNLNFPIKDIILDGHGSAYVTNDKNEVYHLDLYGWGSKKVNADNITQQQFKDIAEKIQKENKNDVITSIAILDENTKGGNLKVGDTYVGTTNGVYLIHGEYKVAKFDNLDFPIKDIILDGKGSAYVINDNDKCEIYHLDLYGWDSKKTNMESCDLKKELKLYYDEKKEDIIVNNTYVGNEIDNFRTIYELNLGKINPLKYKKISFLYNQEEKIFTKTSLGSYMKDFGKELHKYFDNKINLQKIIKNKKENKNNELESLCCNLQTWNINSLSSIQNVGLSWYWENNNYYLQLLIYQYAYNDKIWSNGGGLWLGIGSGIKLYNDEIVIETQILNSEEFYYYDNKKNQINDLAPNQKNQINNQYIILNLGKINPLNYQKIEFLGNIDSDCWGTMVSWGREESAWVYTNDCVANWGNPNYRQLKGQSIKTFLRNRNNKFHDIIENTKNQVSSQKEQILQKFFESGCTIAGYIDVNQRFGLSWYWENDNYYLKVWTLQYCNWKYCNSDFDCHIKIGSGIKLYNEDTNSRKRREIFDINNLEEKPNKTIIKNELKNITKWTDEFIKDINHKQHLPQIKNLSNYVGNNITNL